MSALRKNVLYMFYTCLSIQSYRVKMLSTFTVARGDRRGVAPWCRCTGEGEAPFTHRAHQIAVPMSLMPEKNHGSASPRPRTGVP